MFAFLVEVGLEVGVLLYQKWRAAKAAHERSGRVDLGDVRFPRAVEGEPVPLFWGRVLLRGGNVVWTGALQSTVASSGAVAYSQPFQMVLGIPGAPFASAVRLYDLSAGKALPVAETGFVDQDRIPLVTGGYGGWYAYWSGGERFGAGAGFSNSYFDTLLAAEPATDATLIPNYKGYCLATFFNPVAVVSGAGQTGWPLDGTNAKPNAYAFEAVASCDGLVDASLGPIGPGFANPVNVLYDILTNTWARCGLPTSKIDLASFLAVGTVLQDEQHGFSLAIYNAQDAREVIREIEREIDGVLYEDPADGLYHLALVRDDYSIGSIPLFTNANCTVTAYSQATWEDTFNIMRLTYTEPNSGVAGAPGFADRTVVEQDLGNLIAQGKQRATEVRYPGICSAELAQKVCARDLRAVSRPLAKVTMRANRDAYLLRPASVFRLQYAWHLDDGSTVSIDNVFRVAKIDLGDLDDGTIVITAAEDVFAIDHATIAPPSFPYFERLTAYSILERVFDEAPRWLQARAFDAGRITSIEVQRAWYLAVANSLDAAIAPDLSTDGGTTFVQDAEPVSFPPRAVLAADYSATTDAYDTGAGITISNLHDWTPLTTVDPTLIASDGVTLLRIDDEILAYETATDLGGGTWSLTDVWRGCLDTVPAAHATGARVWVLGPESAALLLLQPINLTQIGTLPLPVGESVIGRLVPRDSVARMAPASDQPTDTLSQIMGRTALPYPVAALTINDFAAPAELTEDGIVFDWLWRDRLQSTITRGDGGSEIPEADTQLALQIRKGEGSATTLATITDTSTTTDGPYGTGAAGYGDLTAQVVTSRGALSNWQTPSVTITAPEHRNLLLNPRFRGGATTHWTATAGAIASSNAVQLGGTGYAVGQTGGTDPDYRQDVDVTGYVAGHMRATLEWRSRNRDGDADDTLQVDLYSIDALGSILDTATYGPAAQSTATWDRRTLEIADLDPATVTLRVRVRPVTAGADAGSDADSIATEFSLTLGQVTAELLSNGDFESGLTSWTAVTGTFTVETTGQLYTGAKFVRGDNVASAEYKQEVAVPAGWQYGTAVLTIARINDAASDTGEVIVEALDGGGSVLATATTGAEAITPTNEWQRRRVTLDIGAAVTVRVRLLATRVSSPVANTCFDDASLRIHKHLDPDHSLEWRFDEPIAQPLPVTRRTWEVAFPSVTAPNVFAFDGQSVSSTVGRAEMQADAGIEVNAKCVGVITDASAIGTAFTTCFESLGSVTDADLHARGDASLCRFKSADAFTVLLAIRANYPNGSAAASGLCGRYSATGWSLEIDSSGHGVARIEGIDAAVTVTGSTVLTDGALRWVALVYDPTGPTLHLVDAAGDHSTSAAASGEIDQAGATLFRLFRSTDSQTPFLGQIVRAWAWNSALSAADIASLWTHGSDASGDVTTYTRGGVIAAPMPDDVKGVVVARYGTDQQAPAYNALATASSGTGWGLALQPAVTNLIIDQDPNAGAHWSGAAHGVTLATYKEGPEGFHNGVEITGTSTDYLEIKDLVPGTAGTVPIVLFARAAAAGVTMRVEMVDDSGAHAHHSDVALGASGLWQRVDVSLTWDAATTNGRIRVYPTTGSSATIQIAGPFFLGAAGVAAPYAIPTQVGVSSVGARATSTHTLWEQINHEGEITAEVLLAAATPGAGTICNVHNGVNDHDRRRLRVTSGSDAGCVVYDGSGTAGTEATTTQASWSAAVTKQRGRWARAGVVESPTKMSRIVNGSGAGDGRVAAWTASATVPNQIDFGHANGSDVAAGLLRRITLYAREHRLDNVSGGGGS